MTPKLLTLEQLAEIEQRLPAIPYQRMSMLEKDRADLLAHIDAYQQKVKAELQSMLVPEPTDAEYHSERLVVAIRAATERAKNKEVNEVAARLGLSLTE